MDLDIVVVNYRTPKDLTQFLASLREHPSRRRANTTVVEVATVGREEPVHYWDDGKGRTLNVRDNLGYAQACNLGASEGNGEIIAFFNADTELTAGVLDSCIDALHSHEDWAIVGPRQRDENNRLVHAGIFGTHARPVMRGWRERDRNQYREDREAVTVSGSAYFVKRRIWEELTYCPFYREAAPDALGAFLPTPHYYEETWCSYHAAAHDYKVVYLGSTTMIHKWHRASPVGGWAEAQMATSRSMFRAACDLHGIDHD